MIATVLDSSVGNIHALTRGLLSLGLSIEVTDNPRDGLASELLVLRASEPSPPQRGSSRPYGRSCGRSSRMASLASPSASECSCCFTGVRKAKVRGSGSSVVAARAPWESAFRTWDGTPWRPPARFSPTRSRCISRTPTPVVPTALPRSRAGRNASEARRGSQASCWRGCNSGPRLRGCRPRRWGRRGAAGRWPALRMWPQQ